MDVTLILLGVCLIIFFGFLAEFIFKKFSIPDVLFLIILGFVIGPNVLNYASAAGLAEIAPVFTTFTLLFLLFDGAFNINLSSLIREFSESFVLTIFNFVISTVAIATIVWIAGYFWFGGFSIGVSLLTGFILGGVSSSFVIPVLKQLQVKEKLYSLLTLESALTDVFCIVAALTTMKMIQLSQIGFKAAFTQIASLFGVAGLIGILGGIIWILLIIHVFKEHNFIMVIAYLILLYVGAESLGGQGAGAITALFFGLMLNNSKQLSSITQGILTTKARDKKKALKGDLGVSATTHSEEYFYHQISFLLKTFFFVYVGLLMDLSDMSALVIGIILSVALMVTRTASLLLTKHFELVEQRFVNSVFARGLAAAAIVQVAIELGIPHAAFIAKITYVVITATIIFSSIRIFILKRMHQELSLPEKVEKKSKKDSKINKQN